MAAPHQPQSEAPQAETPDCRDRTDPATGLLLPDPYPEYLACPACGEAEVEVWCYQDGVRCHNCGAPISHAPPPCCGTQPFCKRGKASP